SLRTRIAEIGDQAVSEPARDAPVMSLDDLAAALLLRLEHGMKFLGIEAQRQRRRAEELASQNGELAPLRRPPGRDWREPRRSIAVHQRGWRRCFQLAVSMQGIAWPRGGEFVARAGHREDQPRRLGIVLDLAPQPRDHDVDAAVVGFTLAAAA